MMFAARITTKTIQTTETGDDDDDSNAPRPDASRRDVGGGVSEAVGDHSDGGSREDGHLAEPIERADQRQAGDHRGYRLAPIEAVEDHAGILDEPPERRGLVQREARALARVTQKTDRPTGNRLRGTFVAGIAA